LIDRLYSREAKPSASADFGIGISDFGFTKTWDHLFKSHIRNPKSEIAYARLHLATKRTWSLCDLSPGDFSDCEFIVTIPRLEILDFTLDSQGPAQAVTAFHPDPEIVALGVRQPWVELILRGIKTVEVRSQDTQIRGTIYLYASKKFSEFPAAVEAAQSHNLDCPALPTGLLVGSVEIAATRPARVSDAGPSCVPAAYLKQQFAWELRNPQRFGQPIPVRFLPYGVWFYPFRRRNEVPRRRLK
jgi:hypothetical protein